MRCHSPSGVWAFSSSILQIIRPILSFCQASFNHQTRFPLLVTVHHFRNITDKLELKHTHPQNSFPLFLCSQPTQAETHKWIKLSQPNTALAQSSLITDPRPLNIPKYISMKLIQSVRIVLGRKDGNQGKCYAHIKSNRKKINQPFATGRWHWGAWEQAGDNRK